jgi:hypothetical protein
VSDARPRAALQAKCAVKEEAYDEEVTLAWNHGTELGNIVTVRRPPTDSCRAATSSHRAPATNSRGIVAGSP